jgi:hypothetical protein
VNFTFNNPLFTFILIFSIQMFVVNLLEYGEFVCKDRILNLLYTILLQHINPYNWATPDYNSVNFLCLFLLFCRSRVLPPLSKPILYKIGLLGVIG